MGVGMEKNFGLIPTESLYGVVKYSLNKNERKRERGNKNIHLATLVLPSTNEEGNLIFSP